MHPAIMEIASIPQPKPVFFEPVSFEPVFWSLLFRPRACNYVEACISKDM